MTRIVIRSRVRAVLAVAAAVAGTTPASALTLLSAPYEMTPSGRLIRVDAGVAPEPIIAERSTPVVWTAVDAPLMLDASFDDDDGTLGQLGRLGRRTTAGRVPIRFDVVARDFSLEPALRPAFDDRSREAALPAIQARLTIRF